MKGPQEAQGQQLLDHPSLALLRVAVWKLGLLPAAVAEAARVRVVGPLMESRLRLPLKPLAPHPPYRLRPRPRPSHPPLLPHAAQAQAPAAAQVQRMQRRHHRLHHQMQRPQGLGMRMQEQQLVKGAAPFPLEISAWWKMAAALTAAAGASAWLAVSNGQQHQSQPLPQGRAQERLQGRRQRQRKWGRRRIQQWVRHTHCSSSGERLLNAFRPPPLHNTLPWVMAAGW